MKHPVLGDFVANFPFTLDDFQLRACRELEEGRGVLVAAPTGSGKTIVGEFAIHLAIRSGRKAFYTTPIKALSNQKYSDLVDRYGPENVGLLTGDNSVNGEAPIVVMTTEVLRNMLYAGSHTLAGLGFVVMDEVHYLADRMRGAVWEEVIIHLPDSVALVSLSATVSNAEEFGEWLKTVRGDTAVVLEERRPVPLFQHVMVGRRLFDLFSDNQARAGFAAEGAQVNAELLKVARDDFAATRVRDRRAPKVKSGRPKHGSRHSRPQQVGNGRRVWIPSRVEVLDRLDRQGLLPAIVFIFSRAGCDAAVRQCLNAQVRLTTIEERDEIHEFVNQACQHLPEEDLHVLGYHDFLRWAGSWRGCSPRGHVAGVQGVCRGTVRARAVQGRVRHRDAGLGDQHARADGRSGETRQVERRDPRRHDAGGVHPVDGAGRTTGSRCRGSCGRAVAAGNESDGGRRAGFNQDLSAVSSFRPSYNMTVNLVHRYGRERSRELLQSSFAQFQADQAVVGLARQARKADAALQGYAESATCHLGDFMEYAALRRAISDAEKSAARERRTDRRVDVIASLAKLRPGDVIDVSCGKVQGLGGRGRSRLGR